MPTTEYAVSSSIRVGISMDFQRRQSRIQIRVPSIMYVTFKKVSFKRFLICKMETTIAMASIRRVMVEVPKKSH